MKQESIVYAIAGALFGLIVGWIIGTQQASPRQAAPATAAAPAAAAAPAPAQAARPMLDESQVTALRNIAEQDPKNVQSRIRLGDMYYDAERYADAVKWYEQAHALDPKNVSVSTDLAVCYYYTDQVDRSLAQFEASLKADPNHVKTYLNMGIVRAFGKQDLKGAAAAWEQVVKLAPGTPEAAAAQRSLDNLKSAHPEGAVQAPAGQAGPSK